LRKLTCIVLKENGGSVTTRYGESLVSLIKLASGVYKQAVVTLFVPCIYTGSKIV